MPFLPIFAKNFMNFKSESFKNGGVPSSTTSITPFKELDVGFASAPLEKTEETRVKTNRNKSRHPLKAILSGAISGAIEISITYPTEYIKTQMQLNKAFAKLGVLDTVRSTFRSHSIFGFYRGISCLLFFSMPKNASRFFAYEKTKKLLEDTEGKMTPFRTLLCGLSSGVFEAVTVVTPMETLKVKLIHDQLQSAPGQRKYRNLFHGIYRIVKEQGLQETYKGLTATVIKQGSNQAIRWLVYSRMKALLAREGQSTSELGYLRMAVAGAAAGAASVFANTPVDVIKTRMQGLEASQYSGFVDCGKQILRTEGPLGFYKGISPRLMRVCLDVAIVMVVYEKTMQFLDARWKTD